MVQLAEDRKAIKKAEKLEQFQARQLLTDTQRLLTIPEARRVFGHLLAQGRLYGLVFAGEAALQTAYNVGYQDFARDVAKLLHEAHAGADLEILMERRAEEQKFAEAVQSADTETDERDDD